jgi:hypothetical protein
MRSLHRAAGIVAFALVALFWSTSVIVELVASREAIAAAKEAIAWGLLALVPAVVAANGSGVYRARARTGRGNRLPKLLVRKRRRGIAVAVIGLTVLLPCALWLAWEAPGTGPLSGTFHAVQAIELVAGGINLILLGLNARDGYRMRARPRAAGTSTAVAGAAV